MPTFGAAFGAAAAAAAAGAAASTLLTSIRIRVWAQEVLLKFRALSLRWLAALSR